ncbi:MAG: HD domain-containing protein [Ruminococcaceae bacterium]|nr:HD domain-containing protein [Oscillospiraceae bacterium]
MDKEKLISDAEEYVRELLGNNSGGHDLSHSMRVYKNAMMIAEREPGADLTVVALASILHDVDDHKLFDHENNENARAFLSGKGVSGELTEEIVGVIDSVSFSKNRGKKPGTLEGQIVQDADRLDAMGAIGIARTFAYGGEHGRSIEESIKHFYDKLLLLKDELNTDTAKGLATKRHGFLEAYIAEIKEEIGE